jgi:hypothetical protein
LTLLTSEAFVTSKREDALTVINRANDKKPLPPHVVVWEPIPGSSQELALDTRANHTLYTGSRGPGKTDTQLMRFARRVGLGYGQAWRGVIFDREYKNLDDLVNKSKKWFPRIFKDRCRFLESKGDYKWVWDTGEELLFRVIKKKSDYDNYHGHEYPFIGWNELTKYPSSELYDMMMSCNRSSWTQEKDSPKNKDGSYKLPPIPLETFSTCNSSGPGHRWVKQRFIDVASYGTIVYKTINVFDPKTQKRMDVVRSQVAIFGSYRENIYLDAQYVAELESIRDPNIRKSWLEGSWDVVSGGAFDDLWNIAVHKLPRFVVPRGWYLDRTFDWGSSAPFSVGWWTEANGEEVTCLNGQKIAPVRGSIVRVHEWYGCDSRLLNTGLRLSAKRIAEGIRDREIALMQAGYILTQPYAGPADNQIRNVIEEDTETIEKKMADVGIRWTKSDKSPGSRKNGMQLFRDRLEAANTGEGAGFYVMDHCQHFLSTVPILPRDEDDQDDVDSEAEDHVWDETRYRVLEAARRAATNVKVSYPC